MESGGGFTDHRLAPKADFGGTMALGLCGLFPDADPFVGGVTGYGFGWFCSPKSFLRMGSVGGVLGKADSFLYTRESSGKRYVWDVGEDGIFESFGIQLPDTDGGRWIGPTVCGLEISSRWIHQWILELMGCDSVDLDGVQSSR